MSSVPGTYAWEAGDRREPIADLAKLVEYANQDSIWQWDREILQWMEAHGRKLEKLLAEEVALANVMRKIVASVIDGNYGGLTHDQDALTPKFYVETGVLITDDEYDALGKLFTDDRD